MKRRNILPVVLPALLALTAACADPRANEVTATRAATVDPNCVASSAANNCPVSNPGELGAGGAAASSIGTSMSRSLMWLF